MSNEIEKDYDSYCEEINQKVEQAAKLLNEARELATKAGIQLKYYDEWSELRAIVPEFIDPTQAWDPSSSWCPQGWDDSGCSY